MAVFLVNQCTFTKLPNVTNDQQASPATASSVVCQNGAPPNQQPLPPTTNAAVGVGLSSSNICGLKFDSLLELIHHIEDNHINEVEYQGISAPYYSSLPQQHHHHPLHPHHHQIVGPHQQHIQQQIYSDNQRMQNIINGHWLPTSCILRIFNSTHKQVKKEIVGGDNPIGSPATPLFHSHSQQPTPQPPSTHQQPMTPQPHTPHTPQQMTPQPHQPLSVEMVTPSPQMCTPTPMDTSASHHIILASPKIVGNMYHGSPYHVASGPIATTQLNMTAVTLAGPTVSQPIGTVPQLVNVNNNIQAQQIQLQQQPQLQQQTIQMQPQMHPHPHQQATMATQVCPTTPQPGPPQQIQQVQTQLQPQVQPQLQPRLQATTQMQAQLQQQPQLQSQLQAQPLLQQHQESMAVQPQMQAPVSIQNQLQPQQLQPQTQIPSHQSQQIHPQQPSNPQPQPLQQQPPAKPVSAAKPFKCLECGRSYKTQKNYNIHVANQHQKEVDVKPTAPEFNNSTSKT